MVLTAQGGRGHTVQPIRIRLTERTTNRIKGNQPASIVQDLLVVLTTQGEGPYSSTNKNLS